MHPDRLKMIQADALRHGPKSEHERLKELKTRMKQLRMEFTMAERHMKQPNAEISKLKTRFEGLQGEYARVNRNNGREFNAFDIANLSAKYIRIHTKVKRLRRAEEALTTRSVATRPLSGFAAELPLRARPDHSLRKVMYAFPSGRIDSKLIVGRGGNIEKTSSNLIPEAKEASHRASAVQAAVEEDLMEFDIPDASFGSIQTLPTTRGGGLVASHSHHHSFVEPLEAVHDASLVEMEGTSINSIPALIPPFHAIGIQHQSVLSQHQEQFVPIRRRVKLPSERVILFDGPFSDAQHDTLMDKAKEIETEMNENQKQAYWQRLAINLLKPDASDFQTYYEEVIRPAYYEKNNMKAKLDLLFSRRISTYGWPYLVKQPELASINHPWIATTDKRFHVLVSNIPACCILMREGQPAQWLREKVWCGVPLEHHIGFDSITVFKTHGMRTHPEMNTNAFAIKFVSPDSAALFIEVTKGHEKEFCNNYILNIRPEFWYEVKIELI